MSRVFCHPRLFLKRPQGSQTVASIFLCPSLVANWWDWMAEAFYGRFLTSFITKGHYSPQGRNMYQFDRRGIFWTEAGKISYHPKTGTTEGSQTHFGMIFLRWETIFWRKETILTAEKTGGKKRAGQKRETGRGQKLDGKFSKRNETFLPLSATCAASRTPFCFVFAKRYNWLILLLWNNFCDLKRHASNCVNRTIVLWQEENQIHWQKEFLLPCEIAIS